MAKILVVDDERTVRQVLVQTMLDMGYQVVEAKDGGAALEMAVQEQPDAILLDVMMPVMDGFEVMKQLRKDPGTGQIPVLLLTGLPPIDGEQNGLGLGAAYYITKPWNREMLERTVRVAIRGASDRSGPGQAEALAQAQKDSKDADMLIRTAGRLVPLEQMLDGGIRVGTMSLIEGAAASGKSVLCQHLAFGSLVAGHRVAYFTAEHDATSLGEQMSSLDLDVSKYIRGERMLVFPVEGPPSGGDQANLRLASVLDMERLSPNYDLFIVDNVTNMATHSPDPSVFAGFLSSCEQLCRAGKTIVLVIHSYAFDEAKLGRLQSLCDTHLRLRTDRIRSNLVHILDVVKVNNIELRTGNTVYFNIETGIGMKVSPMSSVRA